MEAQERIEETMVHWPGAYEFVSTTENIRQGDIIKAVVFPKINPHPNSLNDPLGTFNFENIQTLPAVIISHDCDACRDSILQVVGIRNSDDYPAKFFPSQKGNSEKKRRWFKDYGKNLRLTTAGQIHRCYLPPSPSGQPFDGYVYIDYNTIASLNFDGLRSWMQATRIGRLSRDMVASLMNGLHYRFTREGRNDYFWLGPTDALAKYSIELVDAIMEVKTQLEDSEDLDDPGIESDKQNELGRLQNEQEELYQHLCKHLGPGHLRDFYREFYQEHPDLNKVDFIDSHLRPLQKIWEAVAQEPSPWSSILLKPQ